MKSSNGNKEPEKLDPRQRAFIDSLTHNLGRVTAAAWMPIIADAWHRQIQQARFDEKAGVLERARLFVAEWSRDLISTVISDLACYVQNHRHEFSGNEVEWIGRRLAEVWDGMLSEDDYRSLIAVICDGECENLEKWRAPLWLDKTRGDEARYSDETLDERQTDKMVEKIYILNEAPWQLMGTTSAEIDKMCDLHVRMCQGQVIPPGFRKFG